MVLLLFIGFRQGKSKHHKKFSGYAINVKPNNLSLFYP